MARAAPRTVVLAVGWAWRTSPRLTVLAGVVQLLAGAVTAFGLLATADVFTQLLEQGPTPERLLAALPAIAAVVAAFAARGLLDATIAALQGALVPRVEQRAHELLHEVVLDVELAAFDDADFAELVERAALFGPGRIREAVSDTGDLIASVVSLVAAVVAAGALHPVLAPVVLLAALPQGWASVRAARLMFASVLRMNSAHRRRGVTSNLITDRDAAAEVRAFTTQGVLLGEHRRIADEITADAMRLSRDRTDRPAARPHARRDRHRPRLPGAGPAALRRRAAARAGRGGRRRHAHGRPGGLAGGLSDEPPLRGQPLRRPLPHLPHRRALAAPRRADGPTCAATRR